MEKAVRRRNDAILRGFSVASVILLIVALAYYLVMTGPSVEILNFSQSSGPVTITGVNANFDSSSGQLQLILSFRNDGSSSVGYQGGCVSPFIGITYPVSIANITLLGGVATCEAITQYILFPNGSGTAVWPYSPRALYVYGRGKFYANLTLFFGYYNKSQSAVYPAYLPNGTYSSENISVEMLALPVRGLLR